MKGDILESASLKQLGLIFNLVPDQFLENAILYSSDYSV